MFKMYDFQCKSCEHIFEDLVRPEEANPACQECGAAETTRLLSAPKIMGVAMADAAKSPEDQMLLRRSMALQSKLWATKPSERPVIQKEIDSLTKAAVKKQGGTVAD
jgi:putative FmdB family regulatory protein